MSKYSRVKTVLTINPDGLSVDEISEKTNLTPRDVDYTLERSEHSNEFSADGEGLYTLIE